MIDGILVGDSGYTCRPYLMTPILKPKNVGEVCYNIAHRHTRWVIKRCFGLLKQHFPSLHLGLCNTPANTLIIIVAMAVLLNFTLLHQERDFDEDIEDEGVPFDIVAAADASGNAKCQLIISQYFSYWEQKINCIGCRVNCQQGRTQKTTFTTIN